MTPEQLQLLLTIGRIVHSQLWAAQGGPPDSDWRIKFKLLHDALAPFRLNVASRTTCNVLNPNDMLPAGGELLPGGAAGAPAEFGKGGIPVSECTCLACTAARKAVAEDALKLPLIDTTRCVAAQPAECPECHGLPFRTGGVCGYCNGSGLRDYHGIRAPAADPVRGAWSIGTKNGDRLTGYLSKEAAQADAVMLNLAAGVRDHWFLFTAP